MKKEKVLAKGYELADKTKRTVTKGLLAVYAGLIYFLDWSGLTAFASGETIESVTINASATTMSGMVSKIVGLILSLVKYVGIVLTIFGVYQIVMAFKDENPDGKVKGLTLAFCGIAMWAMKSIMIGLGILS